MIHRLHFRKENVTAHVADGANLRQACLDHGVDPYPALGGLLSCRGKGFCGTCMVDVDDAGKLSAPTPREARWLRKHRPASLPNARLSCQAQVRGDCTVTTDPDCQPSWRAHAWYSGRVERAWEKVAGPPAGSAP
jgi:ferredoxin